MLVVTGSIRSLGKNNSSAAVQDIIVDGAYLFDTQNGLRIKTWQVTSLTAYLFSVPMACYDP